MHVQKFCIKNFDLKIQEIYTELFFKKKSLNKNTELCLECHLEFCLELFVQMLSKVTQMIKEIFILSLFSIRRPLQISFLSIESLPKGIIIVAKIKK